jgi:hypothetical protein
MWLHTIQEVTWGSWTHQNVWVMKNVNTHISLHTYTCTSYFQEYMVDNKYENVNIMSYLKRTNLISIILRKVSISFMHPSMP